MGSYELQQFFLHNYTDMGSLLWTRLRTMLKYKTVSKHVHMLGRRVVWGGLGRRGFRV